MRRLIGTIILLCAAAGNAEAFVNREAPEIDSPVWINSEAQTIRDLRGKVVLLEFWTFGCYNCRNVEPQIKRWHKAYSSEGLVVIAVHSPEFAYEMEVESVRRYVQEHGIHYSVAIDNKFIIWKRYKNRYWPAMYFIDKQGVIRYVRVGEGGYAESERMIQKLLGE